MSTDGFDLLQALSGSGDASALTIVQELRAAGLTDARIADAVEETLPLSLAKPDRRWLLGLVSMAAATCGSLGLYRLSVTLESSALWWALPALPALVLFATLGQAVLQAEKAAQIRVAQLAARAFIHRGAPRALAVRAGGLVAGRSDVGDAVGAKPRAGAASFVVSAASALVVLAFWIAYFHALGAIPGGFDP